jgi:hypothetical protein
MLIEAVVLGFASGLLIGGTFSSLIKSSFRYLPLLFTAALIDVIMSTHAGSLLASWSSWLLIAATIVQYGLLLTFVILNWTKPTLWLIALGGLCNMAAALANSGKMPISPEILEIAPNSIYTVNLLSGKVANYMLASPSTRLLFLSDIIFFRGFTLYMISAGDIITAAGLFLLVQALMVGNVDTFRLIHPKEGSPASF